MIDVWKRISIAGFGHKYDLSVCTKVEDKEYAYIQYETKYEDLEIPVRKEDIADLINALQQIQEKLK